MDAGVILTAVAACAVGGVVPWVSSELAILGAAVLLPPAWLPVLVVSCAIGQMASKVALYGVTRWTPHRLPARARDMLTRMDRYRDRRTLLTLAVFFGSAVSMPPFYLVTLASGVLRVRLSVFALAGLSGTAARYGALVWAAHAVGSVGGTLR